MTNDELLKQGIDLIHNGHLEQASLILTNVVKQNPLSEEGWLWLGRCLTSPQEKRYCFNQVLSINPNSVDAYRELLKLEASTNPLPASSPPELVLPEQVSDLATPPVFSTQMDQSVVLPNGEKSVPPKKNWVRRMIYLLAGIVIGYYLGASIGNSLSASGFFFEIDKAIALKTINIPEYHGPPALSVQAEPTTISLSEPFEKRLEQAWPLILQADTLLKTQKYGDAIPLWNRALEIVPEYADGYYKRGASYYYLIRSQRAKSEYDHYLQLAISDFDSAINLDSNVGDYFLMRGRAYASKASQQSQRVDFQKLEQVAVENYIYGATLPQTEAWIDEIPSLYSAMVGASNCEETILKVSELLATQTLPAPRFHGILAEAYYCKGDLENALKHINEAYKLSPSSICLCERAIILYGLGKNSEAMADIEKSLSHSPYYGGDRYYLRALLYADQGNFDQAQKDLDFGITQTWTRGGLLSYVQGKIALSQGKKEEAISYFQDAEATYHKEGPLLEQIRQDLLDLGSTPRESLAYPFFVTPVPLIPPFTSTVSPTPSSTPTVVP